MTSNSPPDEIVRALVTAYGLTSEPHDIHVYAPHHRHVLAFSSGSKRYIAKTGFAVSDEDIKFKFALQRYLHEIGYPIPEVYLTVDGEVIWDRNGLAAFVTECVGSPHDPVRRSAQCDAAAAAQGWFHREAIKATGLGACHWHDEDP
jgi:hypothetical protein